VLQDAYRKLARTLDAIPNGFPSTKSGAELRLLAKIFAPEEADLASAMCLDLEPVDVIAARADRTPEAARRILRTMVRKGQIRFGRKEGKLAFGLLPFVVGIYEEQLPRMDRELAELFEAYFQEAQGGILLQDPSIHRVVPVAEAVPADIEIYPYEQATKMLEEAKAWGVRDCICRTQQKLVGKGCDRPVENCLVFAPVEGIFDGNGTIRAITKDESQRILQEAEDAGLIHSPGNYQDGHYYI
jgi:hypothetical protein